MAMLNNQRVPTMDWSPESGDFTNKFQGIWWNYHGIFDHSNMHSGYVDNKVISGCESKHHLLTYSIFSHVKMDWWPGTNMSTVI